MASLQIEKGSFPRYGSRKITDIEYVEQSGETQEIDYTYAEVDTSITPDWYYFPNNNSWATRFLSCEVYIQSTGIIAPPILTVTTAPETLNPGTEHEITIPGVIKKAEWFVGSTSVYCLEPPTSHCMAFLGDESYFDLNNGGVFTVLSGSENYTLAAYTRSTLHTFWKRAAVKTETDPITGRSYYVWDGTVEQTEITGNGFSGTPALPSVGRTHTAYNCEVSVTKTQI